MGTALKPIPIRNFVYGVLRDAEVDPYMSPLGSVSEAINVHFDRKGSVTLRSGQEAIGNQVQSGRPCLGMHNFRDTTNTYNQLLSVFEDGTNSDIYYLNGSTWTKTLENDTRNHKTKFYNFLNEVIRVNGVDARKSWTGNPASAWRTSGGNLDIGNAPQGFFVDSLKEKLYIANNTDRLFFSSIPSSGGTITWDTTNDWVDINPKDGDNITEIKRHALELLVFKRNFLYRWRGLEGGDAEPLINVGTFSQESVVLTKLGIFFHHPSGIYQYTGGYPVEVSRPVSDFVDNMSSTNYTEVAAWEDGDHVYFSLGNVTISGTTFTNVVIRLTLSSQVWTVYSVDSQIRFARPYIYGTSNTRVVGNSNGYVLFWNTANTDNGTPITYSLITKPYELGAILADTKTINRLAAICEKAQGSILSWKADEEEQWHTLGELNKFITFFRGDKINARFHHIRFKLHGTSSQEPFVFRGIEILEGINEGVIE